MQKQKHDIGAMAFYHRDGFTAAWVQAMKFAGKGGRIATMPDIVAARVNSKPGEIPWETYFTTNTAEYYGISRSGEVIIIVAHGIGPMSTLEGIQKAYSWEYLDKTRDQRGGRITQEEFWDLEAGKYGPVTIIDYGKYIERYEYPFIEILRLSDAFTDPVLNARLGPQAEKYLLIHAAEARNWHQEQAGMDPENKYKIPKKEFNGFLARRYLQHLKDGSFHSDPYLIKIGDASNCSYCGRHIRLPEKGYAFAHLIATGRLCQTHHEGNESLTLDVDCHEWWNGTRLVGIRKGVDLEKSRLYLGPDPRTLISEHWQDLLVPTWYFSLGPIKRDIGFRSLIQINGQWFTQYPKKGESLDTYEPEYVVKTMTEIGTPVLFQTTIGGYYGFFKYGINEVHMIAPPQANAYRFIDEPQIVYHNGNPSHHSATVQFYQITVDPTKRVMREDALAHDYKIMMDLTQEN